MAKFTDYYAVLEVEPSASDDEIKKSYRRLAKRFHPDNKPERDDARMKAINEAWAILGDARKRKEYDREYPAQRAAQEHADRIRKANERRKRNSAEAKAYADRVRAEARQHESSRRGFAGAGPSSWQPPPVSHPPPSGRTAPRPPSPPERRKTESAHQTRNILLKLAIKLGLLVGAIAFAGAPFGIMALMVPFENANEHNMLVDVFGLAVGLTCIVWILAGIPVVFAALGNLFTDWSE